MINTLATHCVRFRNTHNFVISPRYAYPAGTTPGVMVDHETIIQHTLLSTTNDKLAKLKMTDLVVICNEYGLPNTGVKGDLVNRYVFY